MTQADRVHSTPPTNTSALPIDDPPPAAVEAAQAAVPGPELDLYLPTDVAPETLFQAIGRLRKDAQDEIERLLSFLDEIDGTGDDREDDTDEENEADEPSLGAAEAYGPHTQVDWEKSASSDLEESLGDDEPSLGWTSTGSFGLPLPPDMIDVEDEHDGIEPDVCNEPNLGSFDRLVDQEHSWHQRPQWVQDGEVDVFGPDMPSRACRNG